MSVSFSCVHSKQLVDAEDLNFIHPEDLEAGLTVQDVKVIKIYLSACECSGTRWALSSLIPYANHACGQRGRWVPDMRQLAGHIKVRQRVVATAIVYMRRVYARHSFVSFAPWVLAPACLYLASKAEECCVGAKFVAFYSKKLEEQKRGGGGGMGYVSEAELVEMEMLLLEALDYYLLVFHPYTPAMTYLTDAGLSADLTQTCWSLLNDSYRTDLCLLHAPHVIALGCIYLAAQLMDKDIRAWVEDLRLDVNQVRLGLRLSGGSWGGWGLSGGCWSVGVQIRSVSMELLEFYDKYRQVGDSTVRAGLAKVRVQRTRLHPHLQTEAWNE